ncbi:uncharacterized protein [Salvelinus alpinus]|uniref:uncharacterized protein isoform X2 n=1 Tax=Salvelinus alpinus TaxID=8036 RepID=UPI0039FD8945
MSLQFSLNQTFNSDLSNPSSLEFKTLAAKVTSEVNKAFAKSPGFRRSIVRSFRQVSGSVVTNMTLVFDNQTSVPSSSSVPALLTSSSPSLNILSGSISAAVTTTTPAAAVTTTAPAAATTSASTDPPSSSEGAMSLQFSLNQTFNSDLSNSSSSEFKNLAAKVTSEVNKVFAKTPGFRRSIVKSFRSGSVVTNMILVFDNQTSVPSSSSVPALLTSSSTSLNILSGTISAAAVNTTPPAAAVNTTAPAAAVNTTAPAAAVNTTAPAAAVNTTAPAAAVNTTTPAAATTSASTDPPSSSEGAMSLQFSLNQTFNSDLSNSSSSEFKNLAAKVTSEVNKVFAKTPGFRRSIVKSFRSGSVVTDMILVFDKQSSVPSSSSVPALLTSSSTSLNILSGSISAAAVTTTPPAAAVTTTAPAAATTSASTDPPSSSEGAMSLQFSLNQTFNSDLSNSSSSEFKNLAAKVTSEVNKVFAKTPGFRRSIVKSFRSGSVVTDMTLVFDKQTSVPSSSSVPALLTSSSTSLNILSGSISAAAVTTTPPAAAVTTTAPAAATTSAAVASPDPPSSSEGAMSLQFSLDQTFNSDLSNSSSSEFKNLAAKVTSEVNKAFAKIPGFRRSIVRSFRSGSVVTNMIAVFDKQSSVPSSSSVPALLTSSFTSLSLIPGSISAGSSTSSGSAPRPTAFSQAALPLSLALLMVQLLAS